MKRILIPGSAVAVLVLAVTVYFTLRNKVIIQAPMLVLKNPRVTFSFGKVEYRSGRNADWAQARVGLVLGKGGEIRTGKKSWTDITFNNGSAVRLSENSAFTFDAHTIRKLELRISEGALYGMFHKLFQRQELIIHTPTATASVRGTELGFEVHQVYRRRTLGRKFFWETPRSKTTSEKATVVYALSGISEINNPSRPDQKILLSYQNKTTVTENTPPGNPVKMNQRDVNKIRKILNSIHIEEVLLISDRILFDFNSATLKPASYRELDDIAGILSKSRDKVRIDGHTDDIGDAYTNQILSVLRARAVREYLVRKGIKETRLYVAGYGSSKPIDENATETGRARNRRVEFIVVE